MVGGAALGRGLGPTPPGGDENPAGTLLDELNGSNNGRRSGHAALPPGNKRVMNSLSPYRNIQRGDGGAVYFAKRGAYEDMVYHPYRGSYRKNQSNTAARPSNRRVY